MTSEVVHRFIYSSEDGESCACGWTPSHTRARDGEFEAHVKDAIAAAANLNSPPSDNSAERDNP